MHVPLPSILPQLDTVAGHLVLSGGDGVRVCPVMGDSGSTLAAALGQISTPLQEAILVTPQWVAPDQVSLT